MHTQYAYDDILETSQKINWQVEDLIGGDKRLDFSKPFMPESLAGVELLTFLDAEERLTLNHIRGHGYLYIFGLVEEFILPFVMQHAQNHMRGDDYRVRAFLQFASEEAKHIHLFKRFCEDFEAGFGTVCDVIGPPEEIARAVLAHHPLAVALVILHIEWMTQRHYVESVKDSRDLDPQFKSLLKHHWMEEAQHAKLDTLMVEALAETCDAKEIAAAVDGYLQIGALLDGGLRQQVAFDLEALTRAIGRKLSDKDQAGFMTVQQRATRWTFLGSGMTHENFLSTLGALDPGARERVEQIAPAFC